MYNENMKKTVLIVFAAAVAVCIIAGVTVFFACEPVYHTMEADFASPEGEITHGATGWLYGIAEDEVPSSDLLTPLSPQIACVKAPYGTQHPIGDVLNVAETFLDGGGKYLFVYMQDIYPDWYYKYEGQEDYVAKVTEMTKILAEQPYSDKLIYCPFNESDNGEWYGDLDEEENMLAFYGDWTAVYSAIRAIDEDAVIAGPGFMRYDGELFREFYALCLEGGNLPDMAVWHELSSDSYYKFEEHYDDYRAAEEELGIEDMPICISEYGQMSDNGIPGKMLQYISAFESKKVYACIAYWRLADNLGELAADSSTPTAAWWVYYWYSQMDGETYSFENMNKVASHVRGIASVQDDGCVLLVGGGSGEIKIKLENLPFEDGAIYASTQYAEYDGLGAECLSPHSGGSVRLTVKDGSAELVISSAREDRAYRIVLSAQGEEQSAEENARFEAEDASLTDSAGGKTSLSEVADVAYAASGDIINIPAENTLTFTCDSSSAKQALLQICYANGYGENGERAGVNGVVVVNGEEYPVTFENTLSYSTTTALTMQISLKEGVNVISVRAQNAIAADFIDVSGVPEEEYLLYKADETRYMAIVPRDGYYSANEGGAGLYGLTENTPGALRLKKGVNILSSDGADYLVPADGETLTAEGTYSGDTQDKTYITGKENSLDFAFSLAEGGLYAVTLTYSNNAEDGNHSYNVELAERYAQIYVNGKFVRTVFFRNTYAWDNFRTVTLYLELESGSNVVSLSCNGEYAPATGQAAYLPLFAPYAVIAAATHA